MLKKFSKLFLFLFLLLSLTACNGSPNLAPSQDNALPGTEPVSGSNTDSTPEQAQKEPLPDTGAAKDGDEEPLLSADATDQELLDALGENIHVITEDDYLSTVSELIEHTGEYSGNIYQLEGIFTKEGDDPYISRTFPKDGHSSSVRLPLKYLPKEPEENTPIRVTGIIIEGQIGGKAVTVLEVHVLEILEGSE